MMRRNMIEDEHYDEIAEEDWVATGALDIAATGPAEYIVLGYSLSGGYETVYIADSREEAEEIKKMHEETSSVELGYPYRERLIGYKIEAR